MATAPTPEEVIRSALLRVAENVAKHTVGRSGWGPGDKCFEVDLRAAEAELLAAIREAERAGAERMRANVAEYLDRRQYAVAADVRGLEMP